MNLDQWVKDELNRALKPPENPRDWSLGLSASEWAIVADDLPSLGQNAKAVLDERVDVQKTMVRTRKNNGIKPSLYRLADESVWSRMWPVFQQALEGK